MARSQLPGQRFSACTCEGEDHPVRSPCSFASSSLTLQLTLSGLCAGPECQRRSRRSRDRRDGCGSPSSCPRGRSALTSPLPRAQSSRSTGATLARRRSRSRCASLGVLDAGHPSLTSNSAVPAVCTDGRGLCMEERDAALHHLQQDPLCPEPLHGRRVRLRSALSRPSEALGCKTDPPALALCRAATRRARASSR